MDIENNNDLLKERDNKWRSNKKSRCNKIRSDKIEIWRTGNKKAAWKAVRN